MTVKQLINKLSRIQDQDIEVKFTDSPSERNTYKIEHSYRTTAYDANNKMIEDAVYLEGTIIQPN